MNCRMSFLDYLLFLILTGLALGIAFVYAPQLQAQTVQPTPTQIKAFIIQSSKRHGVDPKLAVAIAEVESGFNPNMIGSLGEIGVFQLRPEYHHVVKGNYKQNVEVAVTYLAKLQAQCSHYGDAYFVCYNYGPTRQLKYPKLFPYYKRVALALKHQDRVIASVD